METTGGLIVCPSFAPTATPLPPEGDGKEHQAAGSFNTKLKPSPHQMSLRKECDEYPHTLDTAAKYGARPPTACPAQPCTERATCI
jgi:hypothetical protein